MGVRSARCYLGSVGCISIETGSDKPSVLYASSFARAGTCVASN